MPAAPQRIAPLRRGTDERAAELAGRLTTALREGSVAAADAVIGDAFEQEIAAETVYADVITPAMHSIGELWQRNVLSVADEHAAAAIAGAVLARVYPRLLSTGVAEGPAGPLVMVTCASGEQHALGARMVADVVEAAGYTVAYFGADLPEAELVEAVAQRGPAAVCLSVTMAFNVPALAAAVGALQRLPAPPAVLVGGQGVPARWRSDPRVTVVDRVDEVVASLAEAVDDRRARPRSGSLLAPVARHSQPVETDAAMSALSAVAEYSAATARQHARRAHRLHSLAYQDALTGAGNRRAFDDDLATRCQRAGSDQAIVILDVDRFKELNDRDGHLAGDQALVELARATQSACRAADRLYRLGGDEFALLTDMSADSAVELAERVRANAPLPISCGVASITRDARQTVLRADDALYRAKREGRARTRRHG